MLTQPDIWVRRIAAGESPRSPPKTGRPDSAPPCNHQKMRRGASGAGRKMLAVKPTATRRRQRCGPLVDDVQFCHESVAGSVVGDHRAVSSPVNGRSPSASASAGTPPPCPLSSREEEDWGSGRDPKIDVSKTNVSETPGPLPPPPGRGSHHISSDNSCPGLKRPRAAARSPRSIGYRSAIGPAKI